MNKVSTRGKLCLRCESVGRIPPHTAYYKMMFNGIKTYICRRCYKEIMSEQKFLYEIKEDEGTS